MERLASVLPDVWAGEYFCSFSLRHQPCRRVDLISNDRVFPAQRRTYVSTESIAGGDSNPMINSYNRVRVQFLEAFIDFQRTAHGALLGKLDGNRRAKKDQQLVSLWLGADSG